MNLDNFDINNIRMDDLLENSVYYPGAWSDGRILRSAGQEWRKLGVNCFFFSDYLMSEEQFVHEHMDTVCGYRVAAHRSLSEHEYLAPDFKLELKPETEHKYTDTFLGNRMDFPKFANIVLYERDSQHKSVLFGPDKFVLFYTNQEGLYTFQQLYVHRHIRPKMLVLSQFWGFAGNYEDWTRGDSSFVYTLRRHRECIPEYLVVGDYQSYHGAQRLLGMEEYLDVKLVGYDMFRGEGIKVMTDANGGSAWVLERKGRKLLRYSCSMHMLGVVYDITESPYSIMTIIDELTLRENRNISEAEVLNRWCGLEKPTERYCEGGDRPKLSLELQDHSLHEYSHVSDAICIVSALKKVVVDQDVHFYSDRMKYCLEDAMNTLDKAAGYAKMMPQRVALLMKRDECGLLLKHLENFCIRVPRAA